MVPLESLGWPFVVALALAAATLILNLMATYAAQRSGGKSPCAGRFLASI